MHRREKSAIQTHRREIVDDLFLEEDLLVKMTREKLFTNGMIEDIKSQRTMRDKTHRLLELLQKRGPDAFSKFISILSEDYKWLAEKLEETYREKQEMEEAIIDSARTPRQLQLSFPPTPRETFPKRLMSTHQISRAVQESSGRSATDSFTRSQTSFFPENFETHNDEADGQADVLSRRHRGVTEAAIDSGTTADACVSPIQTLSPTRRYIHTASSPFPLHRRMDSLDLDNSQLVNENRDDSDDENEDSDDEVLYQDPNNHSLEGRDEMDAQLEGLNGTEIDDTEVPDNNADVNETDEDKILEELFLKLHKINTENETQNESPVEEDFGQITLAMVHEEIDKLVRRIDNAETTLDQVYKSLNEHDPKIPIDLQIRKLIESKDELQQLLEKEKREKDSMVNDMYHISQQMKQLNNLKQRNVKYELENSNLKMELEKNRQDAEKRIHELQIKLTEAERDRTQALTLQPQQLSPQASRRRTTKTYANGTPRRSTSINNYHTTSNFDLFSSARTKLSFRKK